MTKPKIRYGLRLDRRSFYHGDKDFHGQEAVALLVEQLRYTSAIYNREGQDEFTIPEPPNRNGQYWAEANRDRMRSFGIMAEIVTDYGAGRWEPIG